MADKQITVILFGNDWDTQKSEIVVPEGMVARILVDNAEVWLVDNTDNSFFEFTKDTTLEEFQSGFFNSSRFLCQAGKMGFFGGIKHNAEIFYFRQINDLPLNGDTHTRTKVIPEFLNEISVAIDSHDPNTAIDFLITSLEGEGSNLEPFDTVGTRLLRFGWDLKTELRERKKQQKPS